MREETPQGQTQFILFGDARRKHESLFTRNLHRAPSSIFNNVGLLLVVERVSAFTHTAEFNLSSSSSSEGWFDIH